MSSESHFVIEDQILGTSITWEMVEADFQKAFEVPSRCGPNRDARMIENGEKGNTSLLIRADFDWDTKEEALPKTALLKIISCDKFKSVGANNAQMNFRGEKERAAWMHNVEWNLYERARECPEFAEIAKLPAYYCGRAFDDALEAGYLAMEFLKGAVCLPAYGALGVDEVKQVLDVLAKIGAFSIKNPDLVKKMHTKVIDEILEIYVSREKIEAGLDGIVAKFPEREDQIKVCKKLLPIYESYESLAQVMATSGNNQFLCHADLWLGNLLWRRDEGTGNLVLERIIDWQLVHLSSATEDISKFIPASLSPVDYQNSKAELLRYYYKTMEKEVKHHLLPWKGNEEFLQEHEKCMPLMGLISLPIAFYYEDIIFKDFPGAASEKEAAQQLFRGKLFTSLDEIEAAVKKHYI